MRRLLILFTFLLALGLAAGPAYAGVPPQLVADASSDQTVSLGATVMLDGSGSTAHGCGTLTHDWSFSSMPPASAATLSDPAAVKPTFVADVVGSYVVKLTVDTESCDPDDDIVTISVPSQVNALNEPGSLLVYPLIDNIHGATIVNIANLGAADVDIECYSVTHGPGGGIDQKRDFTITLTPKEKFVWMSSQPYSQRGNQIGALDQRKGYLFCWAIDNGYDQYEKTWNHLKGDATFLNLANARAFNYNAIAHQRLGTLVPDKVLALNGREYTLGTSQILFEGLAEVPGVIGGTLVVTNPGIDFVHSKQPEFDINVYCWNEIETKFSRHLDFKDFEQYDLTKDLQLDISSIFTLGFHCATTSTHALWAVFQQDLGTVFGWGGNVWQYPGAPVPTFVALPGCTDENKDGQCDGDSLDVITTVPHCLGMSQANAEAAIAGTNLVLGAVKTEHSAAVPAGDVISLTPTEGTSVREGSSVDITVSLGPVMVAVPAVVGMTQTNCEAVILAAGLTVGTITTANSATVPAGNIMSQNPAHGVSVPEGSSVDIVVSLGPVMVTVPGVVSMSQASAEAAIVAASLTVGTVTTANSNTVPAGDVISQNPVGGEAVPAGSSVDLLISLGPRRMVTVPDVTGMIQADAEAEIVSTNLIIGAVITAYSAPPAPPGQKDDFYSVLETAYHWDGVDSPEITDSNDDNNFIYTLPWPFTFYGVQYNQINIDSNGNIWFAYDSYDYGIDLINYGYGPVISVWNNDLSSEFYGEYKVQTKSGPPRVVIEWHTETYDDKDDNALNKFEIVLFQDGRMRIDYNFFDCVDCYDYGSGISKDDGLNYVSITDNFGNVHELGGRSFRIGFVHDSVPAGDVISQNPDAGVLVWEGSAVDLVISLGPLTVPDVVGMSQAEAESSINALDLVVGTVTTSYSLTVPAGHIISQDPAAGTPVFEGTAIDLVVSLGLIAVPDIVGMSLEAAESTLIASDLAIGRINVVFSDTVPAGNVISQNPSVGTMVLGGTPVDLKVSVGSYSGDLPPDPVDEATEIDPTIVTIPADSTAFLYTGPNPVQLGVAAGAIDKVRAAVLRGRVLQRDGSALPGVTISILDHHEFGLTMTRSDGMFDMAVNGGGLLTVNYEKDGYLPVQRQVDVPWQDFARLPDVVMVGLDPQVTTIDLLSTDPFQTARGSVVTDADGTRQATILFPQATSAEMIMPDGTTQPVSTLDVRATEYTVGERGPEAMPAVLPPTSGYTYAVELNADEAIAAGAVNLRFSQPVLTYVENFLGFPTGGIVPVGYYDRTKAAWIPSNNGLVIEILSISGGLAALDTTGDGSADNGASIGITDAERARVAGLYASGQSLWRVPMTHFTPYDCNWPYGPPDDAETPPAPDRNDPSEPGDEEETDNDCEDEGSIIECRNQTLGERVRVAGTPYTLNYRSSRAEGRIGSNAPEILLSGSTVPASLLSIVLNIDVAGRSFSYTFPALPNQSYTFIWDGEDAYGRVLQGSQPASVKVGYVYSSVYREPDEFVQSFARFGGSEIAGVRGRRDITIWQKWNEAIGSWNALGQGLGGWSLDVHHGYDPHERIIYLGNGRRRSAESLNMIIDTVAGNGTAGFGGDGGPATQAMLYKPWGLDIGPDGSIYIADINNQRIRRVGPDGIISTVAGTGANGFSGDGGPATEALLSWPQYVEIGPDDSIYFVDTGNYRIRRVGPDGIISTVAGTGVQGYSGDGGPATEAQLNLAPSVAMGPDGSMYIGDRNNHRVRRVGPDGIINTVAGTGVPAYGGDGGPANEAMLRYLYGIDIGPDGSIYIADEWNFRIRRIGTDGIITTTAGNGVRVNNGDGGLATDASLYNPSGLDMGSDGSIYFTADWYVRRVGPDGIINTITGREGSFLDNGDGGPAKNAFIAANSVAIGPDGSIYISDGNRIRRIELPLPGYNDTDIAIPSDNGREMYHFNPSGRHLRTLNTMTGAVLHEFRYDPDGLLVEVVDGDGNLTTVERNAAGEPVAIISPYGQRTELTVNANGYLTAISDPAGNNSSLTYTDLGLLTSMTNPRGFTSEFTYDAMGLLTQDDDPAGGFTALSRAEDDTGVTVTKTTAMGRVTTYRTERLATGELRRLNTFPDATQSESILGSDSSVTVNSSDGTETFMAHGPDPRFGMQAPIIETLTMTTPGGLSATMTENRELILSDPYDPLSLASQTDTVDINGRIFTSTYDAGSRQASTTSPESRQTLTAFDSQGRVEQIGVTGLDPIMFSYDGRGRPTAMSLGTGAAEREHTYVYNADGFLESITDPLLRSVGFEHDPAGRATKLTLPDLREINYTYDENDNITSITPPGRPAHVFNYTKVDLDEDYIAPDIGLPSGTTAYTYNLDRQLTGVTRPDGAAISFGYDTGGRLGTLTLPRGSIVYAYDPVAGNLTSISAPNGGVLALSYDGSLLTGEAWTATVSGSVGRTHDNNFWITSRSVNGADTVNFGYDNDGLMTQAGVLTLNRDVQNGLLTGTVLGGMTTSRSYNSFGETVDYEASYSGAALFETQYTYDALGRITEKAETVEGVTDTFDYTYDTAGRLSRVSRNSVEISSYSYDANGNRLGHTTPAGTVNGTYDDQDRMLTYGVMTYAYNVSGDLQSMTDTSSSETTTYEYDVLGNLMGVVLPDPTQIEYIVDGNNRRIGKKVSGTLVQGFLYKDRLNPVAELDGSNTVISRFVYGTRSNIPDYMVKGGNTYRIISDHLGSPRLVVDTAAGTVAQRMDYDEFGNVILDTSPGFQPFGFAGGIYDGDTGLVRFGARDYDPRTGRWTVKDPILFRGGDTNLYGYVMGNPVKGLDPSGLATKNADFDVAAVLGGGAKGSVHFMYDDKDGDMGMKFCLGKSAGVEAGAAVSATYDPYGSFDKGITLSAGLASSGSVVPGVGVVAGVGEELNINLDKADFGKALDCYNNGGGITDVFRAAGAQRASSNPMGVAFGAKAGASASAPMCITFGW